MLCLGNKLSWSATVEEWKVGEVEWFPQGQGTAKIKNRKQVSSEGALQFLPPKKKHTNSVRCHF